MTKPAKNALEWSVFGVALLLVTATVGYLLRETLATGNRHARIEVRLGDARPNGPGFIVSVTARNHGDRVAEDVQVAVTLEPASGPSEEATLAIPYLARHSAEQGWVGFRSDPRRGTLRVSGVAFRSP